MKTIILLFCLLGFASVAKAIDFNAVDGRIIFTNGTPNFYQLALSTTIAGITIDDYRNYLTTKSAIVDKVISLETDLAAIDHFITRYPSFSATATPKMNKIKAQIDLLVALFNTL